jgi:rSAM/selenodomain-associated transferase 1
VIPARGVVIVFAKAPRPGEVKTRMCPPLSQAEAAELYASMLADVLEATARAARPLGLDPVLAVHPPESCGALACDVPTPFHVVAQRGSDLAARMAWAVREAAAGGARRMLLRGSDSPTLDGAALAEALADLETHDVVLRPDRDGGYNLVGLRRPAPEIFDHPMSTASVLEDTIARARRLGLSTKVAEPGFDLDTLADLRWLARERDRARELCARTLDFVDRRGLWRHAPARP